ncbi:MAG: glucosaminidase domain-containing protein [Rhodocyclaceae bacterium]|nr:glucosaminidase domain-containing protein [Rhodocyclaceae bacterium]
MKPQDFIALISPAAQTSAKTSGIPASFTVAEAALESDWGASQLARNAMNLFGVKADASWHGDVLTLNTREYLHGTWVIVPARWRKYSDWQGCMDDHAAFLRHNRRYASCFLAATGEAFARAVAAAGYATDPLYADKLISVMRAHQLSRLDLVNAAGATP